MDYIFYNFPKIYFIFFPIFLVFASISIHFGQIGKSETKILKHKFDDLFPSKRFLSSAAITNLGDNQYYVEASLGTPQQDFKLLISSNSPWIWVNNINCSKCRRNANKFDSSKSSTFSETETSENLESVGEISGKVCIDAISIGNSQIEVKNQSFVLADAEKDNDLLMVDGVFGLGFDENNTKSFISSLKDAGNIENRQFAVYLNYYDSYSDVVNYGNSSIVIDGYDTRLSSMVNKGFSYVSLNTSEQKWQVNCNFVTFGNNSLTQGPKAIISLGTSWILGPRHDIAIIMSSFLHDFNCTSDSGGYFKCDCNKIYPEIVFQLGKHNFTINSSEYFDKYNNFCYPSFGFSVEDDTWILGDTFLRRFYTNFDMDNLKIGFAKLEVNETSPNPNPNPPPTPSPPTPPTPEPPTTNNQTVSNPLLSNANSSSADLWAIVPIPIIFVFIAIPSAIFIYWKSKKIAEKIKKYKETGKRITPDDPAFLPVEDLSENANLAKTPTSDIFTRESTPQYQPNKDNEKNANLYPTLKETKNNL